MNMTNFTKFMGIEQQRRYEADLRSFPTESLEKLTEIYEQRDFKSHIALSEKYSQEDEYVRQVHEAVSDLVAQKRAATDDTVLEKVKEQLKDLRTAIQVVLQQFKNIR